MELSTGVSNGGWRVLVTQVGLLILGGVSFIILFSFGGQVVVAPALLPAQWLVARSTSGWVSKTFSILGVFLLLEVVPLAVVILVGESAPVWIGGVVVAAMGGAAFYRTSQATE